MVSLSGIKINDLEGNLTPDEPKTLKNAKLISSKAYQCQLTSQIQWSSYRKVFKKILALILYRKFLHDHSKAAAVTESEERWQKLIRDGWTDNTAPHADTAACGRMFTMFTI